MEKVILQPGDYAKAPAAFVDHCMRIADAGGVRPDVDVGKGWRPGVHGVWVCSGLYRGKVNTMMREVTKDQRRLTPGQFLLALEEMCGVEVEVPITIGDHEVEVKFGGIQVGCTYVSNEIIEKVYNLTHKK